MSTLHTPVRRRGNRRLSGLRRHLLAGAVMLAVGVLPTALWAADCTAHEGMEQGAINNTCDATAIAFGGANTASGESSTAFGLVNTASGELSAAFGAGNTASGEFSSAFGYGNTVTVDGNFSNAFGAGNSVASGFSNIFGTGSSIGVGADSSLALGVMSVVGDGAQNAIAMGHSALVGATDGIALGHGATVIAAGAVALGSGSTAATANTLSVGHSATDIGPDGITPYGTALTRRIVNVGAGDISSAASTDAVNGGQLYATNQGVQTNSTAIDAINDSAVFFTDASHGQVDLAGARLSNVAAGTDDTDAVNVQQLYSVLGGFVGSNAYMQIDSTGPLSIATGTNNILIGSGSNSTGNNTISSGFNNTTNGNYSITIGNNNTTSTTNATAIGNGNTASGAGAVSMGDPNVAVGDGALAIGKDNTAYGDGALALGNTNTVGSATVDASGSVALGRNVTVTGVGSLATGDGSQALGDHAIAIGTGTDGQPINAYGALSATAIGVGYGATASGAASIAIGGNATTTAGGFNTAVGGLSQAGDYASAFGTVSHALGYGSVAVGTNTNVQASADAGVAIGEAAGVGAAAKDSVALGAYAHASAANSVALGAESKASIGAETDYLGYLVGTTSSAGEVSIGNDGRTDPGSPPVPAQYRKLTHLAAGSADTDAVNVAQLKAVDADLIYWTQDMGNAQSNISLYNAIQNLAPGGSATFKYFHDNSTGADSQATGSEAIAVGSTAVASGDDSVAVGHGASASADGAVALGAHSVADRDNAVSVGAAGSERQITHVAAGSMDTDAVNLGQLHEGMRQAVDWAHAYTDRMAHRANAGVASAMAMSGMPQAYLPGKSMASVAAGSFRGESAMAVGVSTISDNGRWVYKLTGSADTRGDAGFTVGAGIQW